MIWTVMPSETVINEGADFPELKDVSYAGRRILCYHIAAGKMRVFRVLSSDPADYLIPELQPGSILDIHQLKYE